MSATFEPYPASNRDLLIRLAQAGACTGLVDGLFSSILSAVFDGSTVTRLFQGVASVLVGSEAFDGGTRTLVIGLLMHVCVAFGWSAVFLFLVLRSSWVRGILASRYGVVKVALLYGPFIWMVMSLAVIPILAHRAPTIGLRWWIQLIGHFPFVGLPIVASSRGGAPGASGQPRTTTNSGAGHH